MKTSAACGSEEGNALPDKSEAIPMVIGYATIWQLSLRTTQCTDRHASRLLGLRVVLSFSSSAVMKKSQALPRGWQIGSQRHSPRWSFVGSNELHVVMVPLFSLES